MKNSRPVLSAEQRVAAFVEALPYIKKFSDAVFVIKLGGSSLVEDGLSETFAEDIALLHAAGMKIVVVHGGGPQISAAVEESGKKSVFRDGMRVTDQETFHLVRSVLIGKVNRKIVESINAWGTFALGISGEDAGLLQGEIFDPELGFVGKITTVDPTIIKKAHEANLVPIVSSLMTTVDGVSLNVNADVAAAALASACTAEKVLFLTDVPGLLEDVEDRSSLLSSISLQEVKRGVSSGVYAGGILPKVQACIDSLESGVQSAHILDGTHPHVLLLELLTDKGIGTMISHEPKGATDEKNATNQC